MECPICFHVTHRRIVVPSCSSLHWVCSVCSRSLQTCPFCRKDWKPDNIILFSPASQTFSCCLLKLINLAAQQIGIFEKVFDDTTITPGIDANKTILEMQDGTKMTLLQYVIYTNDLKEYPHCEKCQLISFREFCKFHFAETQVSLITRFTESNLNDWTKFHLPEEFELLLSYKYQPIRDKMQKRQIAKNREYFYFNKINKIIMRFKKITEDQLFLTLLKEFPSQEPPTREEFQFFIDYLCKREYIEKIGNEFSYVY